MQTTPSMEGNKKEKGREEQRAKRNGDILKIGKEIR